MKRNAIRLAKEILRDRRKRADGGTDEWQSTGKLINEDNSINWGNPDVASDFFRADKEDLRRRKEAELADAGGDEVPLRPKTAEGRQMAEPRVSPPKQEIADGDAPPSDPDTFRMPMQRVPVMAGATPPLSSDLDRGPMPPEMQAVANRYSFAEPKEPLTDEQRRALALQQWREAGRSGTPENPDAAPIVQASATTTPPAATPPAATPPAARQLLQFGPTAGAPAPFTGGTTERPVPDQTRADQVWQRMLVQESGNRQFRSDGRLIVSPAGAIGIAQVMPRTGPEAARLAGLPWSLERLRNDPEYNRALGRAYYDAQLQRFGDPILAAAAYNGGPGRVAQALRYSERTGRPFTDFVRPETRNYVAVVSAAPRRAPLRFGPSGYEEGGRVGYADKGAVRDSDDPRQWLEFGGQEMDRAPAGLPIGQAVGTSTAGHIGAQLADATELAHQAATNQLPPDYFHTDKGIERAFNAASAPMFGSFALAPAIGPTVKSGETALSMFVPVLRDDPALATAKEMLAKGKSKAEIWRETGMHPGPESHFGSYELESKVPDEYGRYQRIGEMPEAPEPRWFKEISDEGLKLTHNPEKDTLIWPGSGINMKNKVHSVEHPELQAQFPEFEQVNKSVNVNPVHQTTGFYASSGEYAPGQYGKHLQIHAETPEQARSVAAHELQHFVADVGGLEQGNNPSNPVLQDFFHNIRNEAKETYNSISDEFSKFVDDSYKQALQEFNIKPNTPQAEELRGKIIEEARNIYKETEPEKMQALDRSRYIISRIHSPYDLYQHMYGEALARSTEERLHMTPAERRASPPEFNYHNYDDKLIPYTPIPERQLYSEKDLMDFQLNKKNSGGAVDRAMNISRFGTDAVQSAVNLARQHRGRPETPRSTS